MEGLPPLSKSSKTSKPGKMQRDCQQENKTPLSTSTNCPPTFSRAESSTKFSGRLQEQQKSSPSQHLKQGCFSPQDVKQGPSSKISRPDRPPRRPLQPLTIPADINTSYPSQQPPQDGGEVEEEFIPPSVFQFPPPPYHLPHPHLHQQASRQHQQLPRTMEAPVTCVVEQEGHLSLRLRYQCCVDIVNGQKSLLSMDELTMFLNQTTSFSVR